MKIDKGLDPANPQRARVFFDMNAAFDANEKRHPQIVTREIATRIGFRVLDSVPQSIADGWDVWIEFDGPPPDVGPCFRDVPWKPVGQA